MAERTRTASDDTLAQQFFGSSKCLDEDGDDERLSLLVEAVVVDGVVGWAKADDADATADDKKHSLVFGVVVVVCVVVVLVVVVVGLTNNFLVKDKSRKRFSRRRKRLLASNESEPGDTHKSPLPDDVSGC